MSKRLGVFLIGGWFLWPLLIPSSVFSQTGPDYEVYAIEYARMPGSDVTDLLLGAESALTVDLTLMFWLIKDLHGRIVLVDTGCLPDNSHLNEEYRKTYIPPDQAIAKLGVTPEDITDIIITHLHWDHADGIPLFPNAHVWIQKAELEYYATSAWQEGGDHRGVDADDVIELVNLNAEGRLTLVEGDDQEVLDGITVYTGGRHTFASQYVGVDTPDGIIVLASDNAWFYANLDLGLTNFLTFDPEADARTQDRMKELAGRPEWIIPGHDGAVFERFPNPVEGVARIR